MKLLGLEKYVELIASVVVGISLLFLSLRNKFQSNNLRWRSVFLGSEKIDKLLTEFVHMDKEIEMISLIVTENGGGVPHPGSKIKTSIISDAYINGIESYKDHWQNVPVDVYYMTLLRECSLAGFCLIEDTSKIKPSIVKDAALSLEVTSFRLEYVTSTKKAWYYLVLSSKKGIVPDNSKTKDEIRVLKQELRAIIKK